MADLKVTDTTVPGVLDYLRKGEWLVPEFQREFVWSTEQVSSLVQSILEARPIGMVTLWEQGEQDQAPLERLSIPDYDPNTKQTTLQSFGEKDVVATKRYALLDGRQRCSAIAMAFGGFRAAHGQYKYAGRYYLDVKQVDPRKRIRYIRETEIKKQKLDVDNSCVAQGLFPLASNSPGESVLGQWMRYLQSIGKPDNYPNSVLPDPEELGKRNRILQDAFEGIVNTKLAVYSVPDKYGLADICDIFETLNTTGTKVSTVDLIHSTLYADTFNLPQETFLLREWIDELGELEGAIGWARRDERPELIAQFVTACYVAAVDKDPPRKVGAKAEAVTSIKSSDLLATPTGMWLKVAAESETFANFFGSAQKTVAGGYFPWNTTPYPASLAVYVALRWHEHFDNPAHHPWAVADLDALFRAFFWRNALTRRYDQGFLSQVGTDLMHLKSILLTRQNFASGSDWAQTAEQALSALFEYPLPTRDQLIDDLTDGLQTGAYQKALILPLLARATKDLVEPAISLSYPSSQPIELHHIYPKEWCRNNKQGTLAAILDRSVSGRDWVNSTSNLMPLSGKSNNQWKQKIPAQFLNEKNISFGPNANIFTSLFIDQPSFLMLSDGTAGIPAFWEKRANAIADFLVAHMGVVYL
ncbi:DUF262 domain-containing protein [Polaromonas sp. P1(28)-8]|nr:DUF262 domain-containing protein [Polaromonas sp. P1(28)-8]